LFNFDGDKRIIGLLFENGLYSYKFASQLPQELLDIQAKLSSDNIISVKFTKA
jgi:hypothetical protein